MQLVNRVAAVVSLLPWALACRELSVAPPDLEPRLAATEFWSGGELRVTATAFAPPAPLPGLFLDDTALTVTRLDDTTVVARLPTRTGRFPLRVVEGQRSVVVGDVSLLGFQDELLGPYLSGGTYWTPAGGPPFVFGAGDHGAVLVDLRFLSALQVVPDSIHSPDCAMSVGTTYLPTEFIFEGKSPGGTCSRPQGWSIKPTVERQDTGVGLSFTWYVMGQPSPGRWVFNFNNHWDLWRCDSACLHTSFRDPSTPTVLSISPRGDLFLWNGQCCGPAPVIDARTLDTAFSVAGQKQTWGSAFSPDGDTLYLATVGDTGHAHLLAVRTADGSVIHDLSLDSLKVDRLTQTLPGALAVDPTYPRLYAAALLAEDTLWVPALVVLDRRTWLPLGVLRAPQPDLVYALLGGGSSTVVPDPVEHRVYLVVTDFGYSVHQSHARILRFNTLP